MKCLDCGNEIKIPYDIENGEIVSCSCCGLEYEYRNGKLTELIIESEDWGE